MSDNVRKITLADGTRAYQARTGEVFPVAPENTPARDWESNLDMIVGLAMESGQDAYTVARQAFGEYGMAGRQLRGADPSALEAEYMAGRAGLEDEFARSPVSANIANVAPELAVGLLDRGRSLAKSALIGGSEGLRYNPDASERAKAGGIGAGFGTAATALGRIWSAATGMSEGLRNEAGQRLLDEGGSVSAGMLAPESIWKQVDRGGENIPFGGALADNPRELNQIELNRRGNAAIGETGERITTANRRQAAQRLNENYSSVGRAIPEVTLPADLAEDVRAYMTNLGRRDELGTFAGLAEGAGDTVSGSELLELHKLMVRQADLASNRSAFEAKDIQDVIIRRLDSMIEAELPAEKLDLWKRSREQFEFLHKLESGKSITDGNVNPGSLRGRLQKQMPEAINRGDFRYMSDQGKEFTELVDILTAPSLGTGPDSGTAGRVIPWLAGAAAAGETIGSGGMPLVTGAALAGNAAANYASRRAPELMADTVLQAGRPQGLAPLGQTLDNLLYPFVGDENEIQPQ